MCQTSIFNHDNYLADKQDRAKRLWNVSRLEVESHWSWFPLFLVLLQLIVFQKRPCGELYLAKDTPPER